MQKLLTFVLLLVILTGSILPCYSKDCCQDELISATSNDHKHSEGACSPFFSCSSCAGFVQASRVPIDLPEMVIVLHYENSNPNIISTFRLSLFQPPRLS